MPEAGYWIREFVVILLAVIAADLTVAGLKWLWRWLFGQPLRHR